MEVFVKEKKMKRAEMERSGFSDHTNYRNVLLKTLAPRLLLFSHSGSLCLVPLFPSPLFSILCGDPRGVTVVEALPAVSFPSMYDCFLSQLRSIQAELMRSRTLVTHRLKKGFRLSSFWFVLLLN